MSQAQPAEQLPCIVHGHVLAEVLATEENDSYIFPIVLVGPNGERSQEMDLNGKPTGKPGCAYLVWDTGAFELLICGKDAQGLNLPNLGDITVGGVTGSSPAYKSRVTLEGVPGAAPVQVNLTLDCVVDPSAQQSLFGSHYAIKNGLGVIIMGTEPADPNDLPGEIEGQVKIALFKGAWAPKA